MVNNKTNSGGPLARRKNLNLNLQINQKPVFGKNVDAQPPTESTILSNRSSSEIRSDIGQNLRHGSASSQHILSDQIPQNGVDEVGTPTFVPSNQNNMESGTNLVAGVSKNLAIEMIKKPVNSSRFVSQAKNIDS